MLFWKSSLMIKKDKLWDLTSRYKNEYEPNHERGWASMQQKMAAEQQPTAKIVRMSGMRKWLRVAAVFAVFVGGAFLFQQFLNDGMESLATNDGATKEIQLSDGSKIWLNENSELRYPETFEGDKRVVYLKGEAFFDVAKNPNQPFEIKMEDSEIRVIGTSFNVRSHESEDFVEVQVETGKVMFKADEQDAMALLPMDKAIFNKKAAKVKQIKDTNTNACAWKRNELRFNNTPLKEVFNCMERFYKIDFDVENQDILACGGFSTRLKKGSLQKAITTLTKTYNVEFVEQNDGSYLIKNGACPN